VDQSGQTLSADPFFFSFKLYRKNWDLVVGVAADITFAKTGLGVFSFGHNASSLKSRL